VARLLHKAVCEARLLHKAVCEARLLHKAVCEARLLHKAGARDDGVAVASGGPYANHLHLAPIR